MWCILHGIERPAFNWRVPSTSDIWVDKIMAIEKFYFYIRRRELVGEIAGYWGTFPHISSRPKDAMSTIIVQAGYSRVYGLGINQHLKSIHCDPLSHTSPQDALWALLQCTICLIIAYLIPICLVSIAPVHHLHNYCLPHPKMPHEHCSSEPFA
jgi:hypothetical protein